MTSAYGQICTATPAVSTSPTLGYISAGNVVVVPSQVIPCEGVVAEWSVNIKGSFQISLFVWNRTSDVDYRLVGMNDFMVMSDGDNVTEITLKPDVDDMIPVQPGYVVGFLITGGDIRDGLQVAMLDDSGSNPNDNNLTFFFSATSNFDQAVSTSEKRRPGFHPILTAVIGKQQHVYLLLN